MNQLHAQDTGTNVNIGSNIDLTSYTPTLTIVAPDGSTTHSIPLIIGTDVYNAPDGQVYQPGFWVYRETQVTDFPVAGQYILQIVITSNAGNNQASDDIVIDVKERR